MNSEWTDEDLLHIHLSVLAANPERTFFGYAITGQPDPAGAIKVVTYNGIREVLVNRRSVLVGDYVWEDDLTEAPEPLSKETR